MPIVADDSLRGVSGIYKIRNLVNEKVYVGSSVNLQGRCRDHRSNLKGGRHFAKRLQQDWIKYAAENFTFEIIEFCEKESLIDRERFWIAELRATSRQAGYNTMTEPDRRSGIPQSEETKQKISQAKGQKYSFTSPNDVIHEGVNVKKFALSQGLCPFGLNCVFNQRKHSYKGWTKTGGKSIGRTPQAQFDLTSPDGTRYVGKNVHRFAKEHGLNAHNLGVLVRGDIDSSQGWIRTGSEVKPPVKKLEFALISPEGKLYTGTSLKAFAKEHGLTYPNLHKVHLGLRNHCKGWRKATN